MSTKGFEKGLWAEKVDRGMVNVIALDVYDVVTTVFVLDPPPEHAFTGNSIGTGKILDLGRAGGKRAKVLSTGTDAARCTRIDDEWR